jgi:hypothetical protein
MGSAMWIQMLLALSLATHPASTDGKRGSTVVAEQRARDAHVPDFSADQKFMEAAAAGGRVYAGGNGR